MPGACERTQAAGDFLFEPGHAHGLFTAPRPGCCVVLRWIASPLPHQGVVDRTEGGNLTGVKRALPVGNAVRRRLQGRARCTGSKRRVLPNSVSSGKTGMDHREE